MSVSWPLLIPSLHVHGVGAAVGAGVGDSVGRPVGDGVGACVGEGVGTEVGNAVSQNRPEQNKSNVKITN